SSSVSCPARSSTSPRSGCRRSAWRSGPDTPHPLTSSRLVGEGEWVSHALNVIRHASSVLRTAYCVLRSGAYSRLPELGEGSGGGPCSPFDRASFRVGGGTPFASWQIGLSHARIEIGSTGHARCLRPPLKPHRQDGWLVPGVPGGLCCHHHLGRLRHLVRFQRHLATRHQ